jgi:hypothetical protein
MGQLQKNLLPLVFLLGLGLGLGLLWVRRLFYHHQAQLRSYQNLFPPVLEHQRG